MNLNNNLRPKFKKDNQYKITILKSLMRKLNYMKGKLNNFKNRLRILRKMPKINKGLEQCVPKRRLFNLRITMRWKSKIQKRNF